ncbi:MAG: Dps family protein [Alphaproteobacteria bacterium]
MKISIGLTDAGRKAIADSLVKVLADTYALALKTQNYHWNVTGPAFAQYHAMFEEQYTALYAAGDAVAERIRTLGHEAPGGLGTFAKLSAIKDGSGKLSASAMIKDLIAGREAADKNCRKALEVAQKNGDEVTADLMIGKMTDHEKSTWMLRSSVSS